MLVTGKNNKWCLDYLDENKGYFFDIQKVLVQKESKYQMIEVFETRSFGTCLLLDGKIQSASADEFIYHEALVHPPMVYNENPENVLIVGGGEGASIREVLKHPQVKKVVAIDIDEDVIEIAKKYLTMMHQGSFFDERVEVKIIDGFEYVKSLEEETFDVAILDLSDPIEMGPSYKLYTVEFYEELAKKMKKNGTIVAQGGSTFLQSLKPMGSVVKTLSAVFKSVIPYAVFVPSFAYPWVIVLGFMEERNDITPEKMDKVLEERGIKDLRFLDGKVFESMTVFPKFIRENMMKEAELITLDNPLFVT